MLDRSQENPLGVAVLPLGFGGRKPVESGELPFGMYRQMLSEAGTARECPVVSRRCSCNASSPEYSKTQQGSAVAHRPRDPEAPARSLDVAVLLDIFDYPLLSSNFSLILGHFDPPDHPVSSRRQDVRLDL